MKSLLKTFFKFFSYSLLIWPVWAAHCAAFWPITTLLMRCTFMKGQHIRDTNSAQCSQTFIPLHFIALICYLIYRIAIWPIRYLFAALQLATLSFLYWNLNTGKSWFSKKFQLVFPKSNNVWFQKVCGLSLNNGSRKKFLM